MSISVSLRACMLASLALLLLPGCRQPAYSPKPLNTIKPAQPTYAKSSDGVTVQLYPLSKSEVKLLFDGRQDRLLRKRKPTWPFYLSIENQSDRTYVLDQKNINLKIVDPSIVAKKLYSHTTRRVLSTLLLGAAGATVAFFGAVYLTIIGAVAATPALIKAGYAALGVCGILVVGAPVVSYQQGHSSRQINTIIEADLMEKGLPSTLIIGPGQTRTVLLFAHYKSKQSHFNMELIDQKNQKPVVFDIELGERLWKK